MITINTNTTAMVAQNNLTTTQGNLNGSMLKLSTGLRINSASDDAAGMQIANRMETQINGLGVAQRNANDAISMAQTAEGAMVEVTDMLNRMRDLSLQSANSTNTADDRAAMQKEVTALTSEITRVNETTNFAGIKLLNGDASALSFQVGSNANETIEVSVGEISTTTLKGNVTAYDYSGGAAVDSSLILKDDGSGTTGIADGDQEIAVIGADGKTKTVAITDGSTGDDISSAIANAVGVDKSEIAVTTTTSAASVDLTGNTQSFAGIASIEGTAVTSTNSEVAVSIKDIDLNTASGAQAAVKALDGALKSVDEQRADLGAVQNRLESTIDNLGNIEQNMTASQSRIKDVDFAKETTNMTSQQMMMQAGSTVLAQAKQMPQYAAQLMG